MAYARRSKKTKTRTAYKKRPARSAGYAPRRSRRTTSRGSGRSSAGGRSTITIRLVQEAPSGLSPVAQQMLSEGKVVTPRKAKF